MIVTWPFFVSTVVPTGSCCGCVRSTKVFLPGSLTLTLPLGSTLTFLPATGVGSGVAVGVAVGLGVGAGGAGGAGLARMLSEPGLPSAAYARSGRLSLA